MKSAEGGPRFRGLSLGLGFQATFAAGHADMTSSICGFGAYIAV